MCLQAIPAFSTSVIFTSTFSRPSINGSCTISSYAPVRSANAPKNISPLRPEKASILSIAMNQNLNYFPTNKFQISDKFRRFNNKTVEKQIIQDFGARLPASGHISKSQINSRSKIPHTYLQAETSQIYKPINKS